MFGWEDRSIYVNGTEAGYELGNVPGDATDLICGKHMTTFGSVDINFPIRGQSFTIDPEHGFPTSHQL